MLNKILKYDLKSMFKSLIPFYIGTLGLGLLLRLSGIIGKTFSIFNFVYGTITVFFIILLVVTVFYTFITSIKRFYQNMLKDEGYLTNTLPVTRNNLLASKVISSFITFIVTILIVVISILIAYYEKGMINNVLNSIDALIKTTGYSNVAVYSYMIFSIIFGYISYVIIFYLSLILGHSKNGNKVMYSFIYGIVIYMVLQVVSTISLGISMIFDKGLFDAMINGSNLSMTSMNTVYIVSAIISVIATIAEYIFAVKFINKKLNLE